MNTKEGVAKGKEKSRWSQGAGEMIFSKILADLESEPVSSNNLLKGEIIADCTRLNNCVSKFSHFEAKQ